MYRLPMDAGPPHGTVHRIAPKELTVPALGTALAIRDALDLRPVKRCSR